MHDTKTNKQLKIRRGGISFYTQTLLYTVFLVLPGTSSETSEPSLPVKNSSILLTPLLSRDAAMRNTEKPV